MFASVGAVWRVLQPGEVPEPRKYPPVQDNKSKFGSASRFFDYVGTDRQSSFYGMYDFIKLLILRAGVSLRVV